MAIEITTVGPLEPATRDALADFRDERDLPNYNTAVKALLALAERDDAKSGND